jgi:hypothetical protein
MRDMFLKRQRGHERHALKEAERHFLKRQRGHERHVLKEAERA